MRNVITNYFLRIILFLVISCFSVKGFGQKVEKFTFNYKVKGQTYEGFLDYRLETRQSKDILKTGKANFSGVTKEEARQIYLRITDFRLATEKGHEKIKIFFNKNWQDSDIQLVPSSGSSAETNFFLRHGDTKSLSYNALENGSTYINLGFSNTKKSTSPTKFKLNFEITGIGEASQEEPTNPVVTTDPKESTPATVTTEEDDWKQTKLQNTLTAYQAFERKYPNSKYASFVKSAITQLSTTSSSERANDPTNVQGNNQLGTPEEEEEKPKTPEEKEWEKTKRLGTIEAYEDFMKAYPNSEFVPIAQQAIETEKPIEVLIEEDGEEYKITFLNAIDPKIVTILPDRDNLIMGTENDAIVIIVKDKRTYTFKVEDGEKKVEFSIDNTIKKLVAKVKSKNKALEYEVTGGVPPYSLAILDQNGIVADRVVLEGAQGKIEFKKLAKGFDGVYKVMLLDQRKTVHKTFSGIEIIQARGGISFGLMIGLLIGIIGVFFIVRHFYNKVYANNADDFDDEDGYLGDDEEEYYYEEEEYYEEDEEEDDKSGKI